MKERLGECPWSYGKSLLVVITTMPNRQVPASKDWVFTLNNYTEEEITVINGVLEDATKCNYGVYGKEVGESGTPHLQGFVQFVNRKRPNQVSSMLGCVRMHCERWRGSPNEAATYCKKDGNFTEFGHIVRAGVATNLKLKEMVESTVAGLPTETMLEQYDNQFVLHKRKIDEVAHEIMKETAKKRVEDLFTAATLRPWQEALEMYLQGEVDSRQVIWMWDVNGNVGKSWFATYCAVKHDAFVVGNGKSADIKYAYRGQRIVVFDFSRSQTDTINYQVIEDIKNGRYFSTKYVSEMRIYNPPHVVCFSNSEPKREALSLDRWSVIDLSKDDVDACLCTLQLLENEPDQVVQAIQEGHDNYYGSPLGGVEGQESPSTPYQFSESSVSQDDIEPGTMLSR